MAKVRNRLRLRKKRHVPEVRHKRLGLGPVVWCKTCGRKHKKRADCKMKMITKTAKSGRVVRRWKVIG